MEMEECEYRGRGFRPDREKKGTKLPTKGEKKKHQRCHERYENHHRGRWAVKIIGGGGSAKKSKGPAEKLNEKFID